MKTITLNNQQFRILKQMLEYAAWQAQDNIDVVSEEGAVYISQTKTDEDFLQATLYQEKQTRELCLLVGCEDIPPVK